MTEQIADGVLSEVVTVDDRGDEATWAAALRGTAGCPATGSWKALLGNIIHANDRRDNPHYGRNWATLVPRQHVRKLLYVTEEVFNALAA